jgi:nucleoid-associated protein YgaU
VHEVTGAGDSAERLDEIAQIYYGDASMWRTIASANGISDPTALVAGTLLRIPPIGGGA